MTSTNESQSESKRLIPSSRRSLTSKSLEQEKEIWDKNHKYDAVQLLASAKTPKSAKP